MPGLWGADASHRNKAEGEGGHENEAMSAWLKWSGGGL